jgi:hypothetical protein
MSSFSVTAVAATVALDAERKGLASFTVTNTTAVQSRGRAVIEALPGADPTWFTLVGEAARPFQPGATEQYPVQVALPPTAPAGTYSFRLNAVAEANPDEDTTTGPTVTFEAGAAAAPAKRKFPWWIVALVAVVLIGVGVALAIILSDDSDPPAQQPTSTGSGLPALPTGNLLKNGDAEDGDLAKDEFTTATPPGWEAAPEFTQVAYGASGGFPDGAVRDQIKGGNAFFAGGRNAGTSAANQAVDLGPVARTIDAGGVTIRLSAALGGFETQTDRASVTAIFRGVDGGELGTAVVGPVNSADRGERTLMIEQGTEESVPEGTRQILVVMEAIRDSGDYNDGYIDNVSLTIQRAGG